MFTGGILMLRSAIVGIAFYVFSVQPILTAGEKPTKPLGKWSNEGKGGDAILFFNLNADGTLTGGWRDEHGAYDFEGDYSVTKDGVLFGRFSKLLARDPGLPKAGDLFSFQYKIAKDTITITGLKIGNSASERMKKLFERDYFKQKE
jgi:hypothetical protein